MSRSQDSPLRRLFPPRLIELDDAGRLVTEAELPGALRDLYPDTAQQGVDYEIVKIVILHGLINLRAIIHKPSRDAHVEEGEVDEVR